MALQPNILFDLRSQSTVVGNVLVSILDLLFPTSPVGYAVDVFVQITGPTGSIFKPFAATPDVTVSNNNLVLVNMSLVPIDSDGLYQEGDYKFEFKFTPNSGAAILDQVIEFKLDVLNQGNSNCVVVGNLDIVADCNVAQITATDTTDYKDALVTSRAITLNYPAIPNVTTPPSVTSNNAILQAGIQYSNVSYSISLDVEYEHSYQKETILVQESISGLVSKKVICKHNLCKLLECLDKFVTSFAEKAGEKGGTKSISTKEFDTFIILSKYLSLFQQYSNCGDIDNATKYYDLIAKVIGCDCGCGKQNVDIPELISPIGSGGSNVTISSNSPILISNSGGIITISLDSTFVNTVFSALQDVTVTNPADGTFLDISSPSANVRDIAFSADPLKWESWVTITNALTPTQFSFDIDATNTPLRYKINPFFNQLTIEGTFILNNAAGLIGLSVCFLTTPSVSLLATTRIGIQIPVFDSNGQCVGTVAVLGIGATRNLFFLPNINFISGRTLNVNGIINFD